MFGVYVDKSIHHYETILNVCRSALHYTHFPTLIMGALAFLIMYWLKKSMPKIPNVLVAVAITTIISWAIGFQHNNDIDINRIQSDEVKTVIGDFNETVQAIKPASEERTRLTKILDEAKGSGDTIAVLNAEHDINLINVKINGLKHQAHVYREKLRLMLFEGVPQNDDNLLYYLKDEMPQGVEGDGRTWRVKVGNKPLETDHLLMMGGGAVVGTVPRGLPALTMPKVDMNVIMHLLPYAAIISLLGFMEAISIAKAMAAKTGQRLDPNQELIGQGLANILGAVGKSYPVSGSFSRSAVNLQAGAVTGFSSVVTSLAVVIVLLFFTPLLYHLPQSVLAAVIMMAVIGLINVSGFMHAWRAKWYDGAISIISFVCTLAFAPHLDKGIMIGVVLSLGVFLYKSMRPTVASLSRNKDESLRDAVTHGLQECKYIDMVRFDGPLFFANASYLEDQINDRMSTRKDLKHIIIVSNGINDIDASGEEVLSLLVDNVRSAGVDLSFSGVNETVMNVLEKTHLIEKIGKDHIYPTMEKAICAVHAEAHTGAEEDHCPLTNVCYLV
jgi:MFS superfamily sulfate permease-like transporter